MKSCYIDYRSPKWYEFRKTHIGGSDAATILGYDKYRTRAQLWEEKVLPEKVQNTPSNEFIEYGTKAEAPLLELFKLDFPKWDIVAPKDVVFENDYRMASLDALITDENGRKGFGEIKTVNDFGGKARKQWSNDHIPDNYYCQILHYFATWDIAEFAVIKAHILYRNGELPYAETLYRKIERKDCLADIDILVEEEDLFWKCVAEKRKPSEKIIF